jgi:DNA-binding IclR family transcriptional regulator
VTGIAQPVLDDLAATGGELVRLSVPDPPELVWVAVVQGAAQGLHQDPGREQEAPVRPAYTAAGRAGLAALPRDEALALAAARGLTPPEGAAPGARIGMADLMAKLARIRAEGHAIDTDALQAGFSAAAVAIRAPSGEVPGCLSIAAPAVRLSPLRIETLLPPLRTAAARIGETAPASAFFRRR